MKVDKIKNNRTLKQLVPNNSTQYKLRISRLDEIVKDIHWKQLYVEISQTQISGDYTEFRKIYL